MSLDPKKFREILTQILYSLELGESEEGQLVKMIMEKFQVSKKNVREALFEAKEIFTHQKELDAKIKEAAQGFDLERIYLVERSILRLALYRLTIANGAGEKIEIAEALRLAKKFASPSAASFIHAVLDKFKQEKEQPEEKLNEDSAD